MEAVPAVSSGVEKNTPNSSYQSRSADEHDSSPEQMLETEKRCNMRVSLGLNPISHELKKNRSGAGR